LVMAQFSMDTGAYEEFVLNTVCMGHQSKYYRLKDQRYLGGDEFIRSVERKMNIAEPESPVDLSLEEIVEAVCTGLKIPRESLYSLARTRQAARARNIVGYCARLLGKYKIKEVAEHFGREPAVLSQGLNKLEVLMLKDSETKNLVDRLKKGLTKGRSHKYYITNS